MSETGMAAFLGSVGLLSTLEPNALRQLASSCAISAYRRGQPVLLRGEVPTCVYVLRSGSLVVQKSGRKAWETLPIGSIVGEACLSDARPSDATVRAGEDGTVVVEVPGSWLETALEKPRPA